MSTVMDSPAYRVMEFERRFREAAAAGRPPDALRRYVTDEVERFWAHTIPGLDGHVYWDGPRGFVRNDKKRRKPIRWVWERTHGPIPITTDVWTTCGEPNCICPDHIAAGRTENRLHYPDERIIGAAQVAAMRLGHSPGSQWWKENRRPLPSVIIRRWGSWEKFLVACGLDPKDVRTNYPVVTPVAARAAVRALARKINGPPSYRDYLAARDWLRENGHPTSPKSIGKRLGDGSFTRGVERALS